MVTTRPRIAYPPDTILGELRTSELLVVSCLRLWVRAYCGCAREYPQWRDGLERAGIDSAGTMAFDTLWRTVTATARRTLDIRPIYCGHLGEDEGRFLRLLGLLQHGRSLDAEAALADWCPASAVRHAMTSAQAFAAALVVYRLWLPAVPLAESTPTSRSFTVPTIEAPRLH